ncbi:MAG: serine/threonine-protein kinase [Myxococcales bacterium]
MNLRTFPTCHTSMAVIKAMAQAIETTRGASAVDSWLKGLRMVRDDLADETRIVPLGAQREALRAFVAVTSREAVPELWRELVTPETLGTWMRILRGTHNPEEAFARLDPSDMDNTASDRWETVKAAPGQWHGRLSIAHDPVLESDGLLRLGRLAELRAVPALFGFEAKAVEIACATPEVQEYEVRWKIPRARAAFWGTLGLGFGAIAALSSYGHGHVGVVLASLVLGPAIGVVVGVLQARLKMQHAVACAQSIRVGALERSLTLKEARQRDGGGQLEGSVVAGQYRIRQAMGSGASGVIYEAVRITDNLPVAVKLLRAAVAHDAVASDRLRREAEALGLAWHPNVVEVIDHGHLPDGTSFLVMELLRGDSLATRLQQKGRLVADEIFPIAMQICDALAAVHAAGVVHRDLKPSNVFLAIDRDDPAGATRIKLLDFGIARVEWEETRITQTGGPLGTVGYMSPEQEYGGEIDGRSDIFALGALIYECFVGEPPPPLTSSGLMKTGENPMLEMSTGARMAGLIPPEWREVIDRAMAPLPSDRFEDARAFSFALRGMRERVLRATS